MNKKSIRIWAAAAFLVLGMLLVPGKAWAAQTLPSGGTSREDPTELRLPNGDTTYRLTFDNALNNTEYYAVVVSGSAWVFYEASLGSGSTSCEVSLDGEGNGRGFDSVELSNSGSGAKKSGKVQARRYAAGQLQLAVKTRGSGSVDITFHYYADPYDTHKDIGDQHVLELNAAPRLGDFPALYISGNSTGSDDNKTWYKFSTGGNRTYLFKIDYKPTTEASSYIVCDLCSDNEEKLNKAEYSLSIYDNNNIEKHIVEKGKNLVERSKAAVYQKYMQLEPNTTYYIRMMGNACSYSLSVGGFSLSSIAKDLYAQTNKTSYYYDGKAKKPGGFIQIKKESPAIRLTENADYTIAYKDNVNAGTAKLIFRGKGLITGQYEETFKILKSDQELSIKTKTYSKTNLSGAFTLQPKSTNLSVDGGAGSKEFTYKSSNKKVVTVSGSGKVQIKKAGTATITISAPATKNFNKAASSVKVTITVKKAKKGAKFTSGGVKYQITKKDKEIAVIGVASKGVKKVTIPEKIKIGGVTYLVTSISANAFQNCKKLSSVTIAGKQIRSIGKNAFKGIKKNATFTVPKKKLGAYKKLLNAKAGYKRTMKVKAK